MSRPALTLGPQWGDSDAPTKDKSYQQLPLGPEWKAFLRSKRLAGCAQNTLDSYETVGDKFCRYFARLETLDAFAERPELLFDFVEAYWPNVDQDTRQQRFSVLSSFFEWAYRTDRILRNPMGKIERPKRKRGGEASRPRIPADHLQILVDRQTNERDRSAVLLLGRLGLRREDLRMLQLKDIGMATDTIHLRHGKGGKDATLPLAFRDVRETIYLHLQERDGEPDEFLVYPWTDRKRPMSKPGIDQWFHRCLAAAELRGYTMHQLRHAAIDDLKRLTGDIEIASKLARHSNVSVTQTYLHTTVDDLRSVIEALEELGV